MCIYTDSIIVVGTYCMWKIFAKVYIPSDNCAELVTYLDHPSAILCISAQKYEFSGTSR